MKKRRALVDEEMRGADFVVCLPATPLVFLDNMRAVCCHCGRAIQHRPDVPREIKKLCTSCGATEAEAEGAELLITEQQRRFIGTQLKRERH